MTEEQIKNLKAGDKFTIEYEVLGNEDRFITVAITYQGGTWTDAMGCKGNQLKTATLVTPPPTFDVGDTVRIIPDPMTGTVYGCGNSFENFEGEEAIIETKPAQDGELGVKVNGGIIFINIHCLELVKKAVKDRYRVVLYGDEFQIIWADFHVAARFDKIIHPDAKAAAEAECARLNKEWRKKHEGGAE